MGSHHTFCRDMFRAASLVLLQDLTQAMCILIQRKKGKRVKNVISGSSFLVKCLEVQGRVVALSRVGSVWGLSISYDGKAKILSLPVSGGKGNLP